eukprot:scaffold2279_cov116-Isochrysis_galbana.AAC.4
MKRQAETSRRDARQEGAHGWRDRRDTPCNWTVTRVEAFRDPEWRGREQEEARAASRMCKSRLNSRI